MRHCVKVRVRVYEVPEGTDDAVPASSIEAVGVEVRRIVMQQLGGLHPDLDAIALIVNVSSNVRTLGNEDLEDLGYAPR